MKRGLILLLVLAVTAISNVTFGNTYRSNFYPLDRFVERVVEHDRVLMTIDEEIRIAKMALEALEKSNKTRDRFHDNADAYVAIYLDLEYAPKAQALEIKQLERKKKIQTERVTLEAKQAYFQLKIKQEAYRAQRHRVNTAAVELERHLKALELGHMTQAQYNAIALQYENQQRLLEGALMSLELEQMKVNQMLNIDLSVVLTLPSVMPTVDKVNWEEIQNNVHEFEVVVLAKEHLEMVKFKKDVYSRHMYNSVPQLSDRARHYGTPSGWSAVQREVVNAEKAYHEALKNAQLQLKLKTNALKMAELQNQAAIRHYDLAVLDYEEAKVKHGLGLITKGALDQVFDTMKEAFYNMQSANQNLFLEKMELSNRLTRHIVEIEL